CDRLKADERLRGIPVIFISALTEQLDKVKAFATGGVDYITKPFQREELHARVETHLKLRRLQVELEDANARPERTNGRTSGDRFAVAPPAEVADRLNQLFPYDLATEQFATLMYGVLDVATGEFRYVSAGHPGPLHLPAGGPPALLESPGFPIGLAGEAYGEQ